MLSAQPIRPRAPTAEPKFHSVSLLHAFGTADAVISMAVPHMTTMAELIDFIVFLGTVAKSVLLGNYILVAYTASPSTTATSVVAISRVRRLNRQRTQGAVANAAASSTGHQ